MGHKIEACEHEEILLQCLRDSYVHTIISLANNIDTDYLVVDDVATAILEEESRCKKKEDRVAGSNQLEALMMTRGRSTTHGTSGSQSPGRSKSRSRKNIKCYKYGKRGNMKKDCWSRNGTKNNPQMNIASGSERQRGNNSCWRKKSFFRCLYLWGICVHMKQLCYRDYWYWHR